MTRMRLFKLHMDKWTDGQMMFNISELSSVIFKKIVVSYKQNVS